MKYSFKHLIMVQIEEIENTIEYCNKRKEDLQLALENIKITKVSEDD